MNYNHLSVAERNLLYTLRVIEKLSMSLIAKKMNRSKSTISRELKRNTDEMTKKLFSRYSQGENENSKKTSKRKIQKY
jgi:IS30 family transposase